MATLRTVSTDSSAGAHLRRKAVERLASLAPLDGEDLALLQDAAGRVQSLAARRDLVAAGAANPAPLLIVEGWAYRSCLLADGRRQIIQLMLPGDVFPRLPGGCFQPHNVTALTNVSYCSLPGPGSSSRVEEALAVDQALHAGYLYRQIARLGRMSALERLVDWLLELRDRCAANGQCRDDGFPLPLTQEAIADVLGLTSVHVNRTLMTLRRDDLIRVGGGRATIIDRARCTLLAGNQR